MSYPDSPSLITNEYEAAFKLIDVVFSLESCLHHQILPLELFDNHLVVGMVDPKNIQAIRFIGPILQPLGYGFHVQMIDIKTHQQIMATYLQRSPNSSASNSVEEQINYSRFSGGSEDSSSPTLFEDYSDDEEIDNQAPSDQSSHNLHDRPTLIVNNVKPSVDALSFEYDNSKIFSSQPQIDNTLINQAIAGKSAENNGSGKSDLSQVTPEDPKKSIQDLMNLPPKILWQELLAGAISGGIGRLFFRQLANHGHIMCSRDGVIQSSLEEVPLPIFHELIAEIKKMAKLPLSKLKKNKKVALQKFHDDERVLLRGEFFIGEFGDEITLQVLRGDALHFYEQRQVDKTFKKAIYLGRQLEKTLRKIKMCSTSAELGDLNALKATLKQVDKRLRMLDS